MGLKLIKEVGKKNCDLTGEKRSTSYLLQSISIAMKYDICGSGEARAISDIL